MLVLTRKSQEFLDVYRIYNDHGNECRELIMSFDSGAIESVKFRMTILEKRYVVLRREVSLARGWLTPEQICEKTGNVKA